jgi:hypothetical protein
LEIETLAPNLGFGWVPELFGHRRPNPTGENPGRQIRHSRSGTRTGHERGQDGRTRAMSAVGFAGPARPVALQYG